MSEPSSGLEPSPLLDFETIIPPEYEELNATLENLTDACEVFLGDCAAYASDALQDGNEGLDIGLGMMVERMQESWRLVRDTMPIPDAQLAAFGVVQVVKERMAAVFSSILDTTAPEPWEDERIREHVTDAIEASPTAEEFASALAKEVEQDLYQDLNLFKDLVRSKRESIENIRRIYLGRFAISEIFDLEDGSTGTFWYHPFRIERKIEIFDPDFLGKGFKFTFADATGTEGRLWHDEPLDTTPDENTTEELKQYAISRFLASLSAFGSPIEIMWTDNGPPEELEEFNA